MRQSGLERPTTASISKIGRSHARAMLLEAAWAAAKAPGPLHAFSWASEPRAAIRSPRWPWLASSLCSAGSC
ncbi:transposase [Bradyrhizobium sp. LB14.3]|uniref:transposase n=1 Tax=Bradyrhizobium sp. LB14.3 TaxID=3156328 RepID=UPI0033998E72